MNEYESSIQRHNLVNYSFKTLLVIHLKKYHMFKRTAFAILDVITKLLQNTALASLEKLHKWMMMVP